MNNNKVIYVKKYEFVFQEILLKCVKSLHLLIQLKSKICKNNF